ncbi:MAG: GTPase ObgE [Deltaproteobacteria bacterium]|nr:GTPase ObgE [Deltaproteobacteria bacterium]
MTFLDEAVITARSGDGGSGCVSFRRERFKPRGGPDGGDGGDGGKIILKATNRLQNLSHLQASPLFKAQNGQPGKGKNQSGKKGSDLIIELPVGTLALDKETRHVLADLIYDGQEVLLISGGKGGKGNQHFATSTRKAPRIAQPGTPGQEVTLHLSLKFLADIGLVGFPNAGKSTLLSRLTTARPKIDSYPFTTLVPHLGVLYLRDDHFLVLADIPGLIEGASEGKGLGHRFLKHIERTRLLIHLLDITYTPKNDIIEDFFALKKEMSAYNPQLVDKPHMVLINKMDLYDGHCRDVEEMQKALDKLEVVSLPISALTGMGLERFRNMLFERFFDYSESDV